MHEHNYIIIKTNGDRYIKQCTVCGDKIIEKRNVKKTLLQKVKGWFNGTN
jgi:hypothetical protein